MKNPIEHFTYAVKSSEFPEGAKWVCQDDIGEIAFFNSKPVYSTGYWEGGIEDSIERFGLNPDNPNWKQAICSLSDLKAYEDYMNTAKKPHKHAELIKAWADGAEIEYLGCVGEWYPKSNPLWSDNMTYRIKPTPQVERSIIDISSKLYPDIVNYVSLTFEDGILTGVGIVK